MYFDEQTRQADEYLAGDILAWYTDTTVDYWQDLFQELPDQKFMQYLTWAQSMQDSFPSNK
jgi:hypothetical protein